MALTMKGFDREHATDVFTTKGLDREHATVGPWQLAAGMAASRARFRSFIHQADDATCSE